MSEAQNAALESYSGLPGRSVFAPAPFTPAPHDVGVDDAPRGHRGAMKSSPKFRTTIDSARSYGEMQVERIRVEHAFAMEDAARAELAYAVERGDRAFEVIDPRSEW